MASPGGNMSFCGWHTWVHAGPVMPLEMHRFLVIQYPTCFWRPGGGARGVWNADLAFLPPFRFTAMEWTATGWQEPPYLLLLLTTSDYPATAILFNLCPAYHRPVTVLPVPYAHIQVTLHHCPPLAPVQPPLLRSNDDEWVELYQLAPK